MVAAAWKKPSPWVSAGVLWCLQSGLCPGPCHTEPLLCSPSSSRVEWSPTGACSFSMFLFLHLFAVINTPFPPAPRIRFS